jgi:hypothetical protein
MLTFAYVCNGKYYRNQLYQSIARLQSIYGPEEYDYIYIYTDKVKQLKDIYKNDVKVIVRPAYRLFEIMKDHMHYFNYKYCPRVAYAVNNILKAALPYDIRFETLIVQDCKVLLKQRLPKTNTIITCSIRSNNYPNGTFMIYNNFDKKEYLERMKHLPGQDEQEMYHKQYTEETFIYELYTPSLTSIGSHWNKYCEQCPHTYVLHAT